MPDLTQEGLVGAVENFSTTIRAMLDRDWIAVNSGGIEPLFMSGESSQSAVNQTEMQETISCDEGNTRQTLQNTDVTRCIMGMETDVIITIFSPTQFRRTLLQNEIYRILRKNMPLNGSKIKKLDNAQDSAILGFREPVLAEWIPFGVGSNQLARAAKSQSIIHCQWQYNYS